jgi:hypothetical protein
MTSSDGTTWSSNSLPAIMTFVAYSDGLGIFAASSGGTGNGNASSPDGVTWTGRSITNELWISMAVGC